MQGLAAVNPVITFSPMSDTIEILESNSKQKFNMTYTGDWIGKIVEIDCEDRIAWLKENELDTNPINISSSVDMNVDWFRLHNEYNFETVGCAIRTVDYVERW